jgi:putative oxidoreductase
MSRRTLRLAVLWILRVLLCLVFVFLGVLKFRTDPQSAWVNMFERIGLGDWLRYVTGVVETLGGLSLLIPVATPVAVIMLALTMTGAFLTHLLVVGIGPQTLVVVVLLAAVLAVGWLHETRV